MSHPLQVPRLDGSRVSLVPLSPDHAEELGRAADVDRSSYGFTTVPTAATIDAYVAAHLDRQRRGEMMPFAQVSPGGRAIGCTSLYDFRPMPDGDSLAAVMIGWTWLAASAQRSGINTEAKLLLLTHAFETLGARRVDIATDARNTRSQQAIQRLGATFEGVLRSWATSHVPGEEAKLRDSAMYSIVTSEWPAIRSRLRLRTATAVATEP